MRLVVFDTNVIVSAGITPSGVPARLVHDWVLSDKVHVVVSPAIIREYREVVSRPKFKPYGFPPLWLDFLIDRSLQVPDPRAFPLSLPDPSDVPFLALAHAAKAWLVTGNLKHYPETVREGVVIVSPSDYLAQLAAASSAE